MPNYVDDRIVSMQFDNSEFDPNIKKSQKTLEEFEKSLDTKKFEKYADNLNKIDMSGLEKAFAGLGNSFKAFETIAVGALLNVGAKIENFIASGLKRMTIDPISQGWSAYGENIGSVQTIMAATRNQFQAMADAIERGDEAMKGLIDSTGKLYTSTSIMEEQMGYVNKQLDELMSFTDETSASYQVMVNNIGKFTSQNIDLKTSVKAMEGIATWANLSGANAEQMSRAMYNISQSLGVGRMLTRDWMSIENANMATVEFKNTVLETAASLGQLKKDANGAFKTLKGNLVTVSNFRDTLSDDWLTSDVLMGALSTYGGFSQEIIALSQKSNKAVSELLYDAIEPISEGTKTVDQAIEELGIDFEKADISADDLKETLTKLASAEYDLGKRAFAASYESKTLGDAINYVGDAIKTGWVKSYQYIVGDYKEAKQLWTWFADEVLFPLFVESGETRNEILKLWDALGGRADLLEALKTVWETIREIGDTIGEVLGEFFPQLKDSETSAQNIASFLVAITRKFKEFTKNLKENKTLMDAVRSGARILGNVLKGILEIARLLYIFLGPTVRFTKELFSNTMKLLKPISDGVDEVSDLKNVVEGLRIAFLVLGTAVALPIKILSIFFNKISEIGNMTLPELLDKIKGWAKGVWESIKGLFTNSIELAKNVVEGFKNGFSNGFKALGDFIKGIFTGLIEIVKKVLGIHSPSTVFFAIGAFIIAGLILGIASMSDKLRDTLLKVLTIFNTFSKAINQIAMSIIISIAIFKLIKVFENIVTNLFSFTQLFSSIGSFFISAGDALTTYTKEKFKTAQIQAMGKTVLEIAISVAIIATAVLAIATVAKKMDLGSNLDNAVTIVGFAASIMAAFMAMMMLLVTIMQKFNKTGTAKIGGSLLQKFGVDLGNFTYYTNTATRQMLALGKALIEFSVSIGLMAAYVTAIAVIIKKNEINIGDLLAIEGLMVGLTIILSSFLGLQLFIQKTHLFSGKTNTMHQLNSYLWMAVGVISTMAASLIAMAVIMSSNHINIGTMLAIEGMLSAIPGVLGGFLALQLFIKKNNLFNTSKNNTFNQLVKYLLTAIGAIAAISTILIILSKMEVSWNAVAQLLTITAIIAAFSFAVLGLAAIIQKMNIPFAVLGKVALIVGVAVTAILTLTVSLALLGPALSMLVDGMEKFEPYLMKFNENAGVLLSAMGKFILFSFMLSVASVFLSVAFVNIGIGLSTLIPVILALIGLGAIIAHVFKSITDAFDKAIDNIVKSAKNFLKNYKLLELALEAFKRLMTWDLVGPIAILVALSFALTNLGIAGWIAAGGLTLLIANAKLAALCINDLKKVMSFFETVTTEQLAGMAKLALGIGALGLAATLTAPGIATLAASILLMAAAIYVLAASAVVLGNNIDAANATLQFLIEHVNDFIKLVAPAMATIVGIGVALIITGVGAIILAVGLTLTAAATLALCINFGIATLLLLAFNAVMNKIKEDNPKLYDSIMNIVTAIGNMATAISDIVQLIVPIMKIITAIVVAAAKAIIKAGLAIYKWWMDNIQPKIEALKSFFVRIWNGIVTWWQTNVQPKINSIKSFFVGIWNGIVTWWTENVQPKVDSVKSFVATIWNGVKKWWRDNIERGGIKAKIEGFVNNIINWFKNPFGFNEDGTSKTFAQFAKGCVDGFINGVTNLYYYCKGKIEEWGQKIVGWFSGKGGIDSNSPSKKFIYYGEMSVLGYVQGIEDNSAKAKDAMNDLAEVAKEAFCDPMGIHSRSAVMYEAGYESVHGYADGVRENSDLAIKAMDELVEDVNKSAQGLDDLPSGKKKALELSMERDKELERDYKATIKYQDKSITGALGNLWDDIKNIWSKLTSGQIKIGEALSALWGSIKEHGGNFLGDKLDSIKNWLFGKGGILEGLGDLLKDPFGNLGIDKILKELQNMDFKNITDSIEKLDLSGVINSVPDLSNIGKSVGSGTATGQQQYVFTQNNYSPKALSRLEIYRQTKRQFYDFKTQEELSR